MTRNILSLHCCDLVSLAGEGDWGLGGLGVILHNCQTGALHWQYNPNNSLSIAGDHVRMWQQGRAEYEMSGKARFIVWVEMENSDNQVSYPGCHWIPGIFHPSKCVLFIGILVGGEKFSRHLSLRFWALPDGDGQLCHLQYLLLLTHTLTHRFACLQSRDIFFHV